MAEDGRNVISVMKITLGVVALLLVAVASVWWFSQPRPIEGTSQTNYLLDCQNARPLIPKEAQ